jgi:hypothetical protein
MDREKQGDLILAALNGGATVTPSMAMEKWSCYRLAARIKELRNEGYSITTNRIPISHGYVAGYSLNGTPVQNP